jgi:hypothetical protein
LSKLGNSPNTFGVETAEEPSGVQGVLAMRFVFACSLAPCLAVLVIAVGAFGQEENSADREWPPKPSVEGDWSEPVDRLRGRLLFGEVQNSVGIRMGVVFLEVENRSPDRHLYYVFVPAARAGRRGSDGALVELPMEASSASVRLEVRDKHGKKRDEVARQLGYRGRVPRDPRWLLLPMGATLRFPISLGGYGWPNDTELGFGIGIGRDGSWVIPKGADPDDYYLAGTMTIRPPADHEGRVGVWDGTLTLPAIKLPVARR